jgi:cytochrome c553
MNANCILPVALLAAVVFSLPQPAEAADDAGLVVFRQQIQPLLTTKCLLCHGADKKRGGLDLRQRATALAGGDNGPALVPGKSADSLLYRKLAEREMPPQNPLAPEQVAAFKAWIDAGAPYEGEPLVALIQRAGRDWWSLRKITRPPMPAVSSPSWVRTPIDAFLLAKLDEHHLTPAPEADRATLVRRVTFDLTGLPPTPEEVAAFVANPRPDAYEALVERLLASPHYGERWGRHWLDVVRFAESHGYETNNLRPTAWPYRDYVIRAFNEDIPYPQFIQEQLAGDTRQDTDELMQAATGLLVGGAHDVVGNQTVEGQLQQRMDDLDDMITTVGATFLGLTTNCARCHDHKFDPISQRDYYGLQAVFAGVQHAERPLRLPDADQRQRQTQTIVAALAQVERRLDELEPLAEPEGKQPRRSPVQTKHNIDRFATVEARFIRFTVLATNNNIEPCIDELEVYTAEATPRNVALAASGAKASASSTFANSPLHRLEHINDGRYGNSRSWISQEPGKGWVQIELPQAERIDRVVWARDREVKFTDRLAIDYRIEVALQPGEWRLVASSGDRLPYAREAPVPPPGLGPQELQQRTALLERRSELERRLGEVSALRQVYAGTFGQPGPTHVLLRGDPMRKGDVVEPSALAVIEPPLTVAAGAPESERRLALARWLGRPDNPLPARVLVNRVWHYHFGQGIVSTPSDFGYNGGRPSHPELLDWLASEFVRGGWRLKPLHRLIVLSAAYRQSGRPDAQALAVDRQNRLLWRMTPRRLEAEALRDTILAVSGKIDRRMGGPGYNLWEKNTNYVVVFKPKADLGPDEFRRMAYQFKPRSQQDPTFGVFDCPDAALARPKRNVSTTVLQALNLLNSRLILTQAEFFAERLRREAGEDPPAQVRRAFLLAFGREPAEKEATAGADLIRAHGLPAFCRAVYNANEFLYVD